MSFWLSFCDPDLSEGAQFLGAAIVPGDDIVSAAAAAHALGCNPGGEVEGDPIASDFYARIPERWKNRLLTREECESFDEATKDELEEVMKARRGE